MATVRRYTTLFWLGSSFLLLQSQCFGFLASPPPNKFHAASSSPLFTEKENDNTKPPPLQDLNVKISGAGPAGLLLAHLLLQQGANVAIYESRPDPRSQSQKALAGFAYALRLGIRGRTAIQTVDPELWQAVKAKGHECDRFRLHVGPFSFTLRDSQRKHRRKKYDSEPSLLLYQADLCISLMEELERRYGSEQDRFQLYFQSRVVECDLERRRVIVDRSKNGTMLGEYDLLVGCDGVNSIVRNVVKTTSSSFEAEKQTLPGEFKVARLPKVPPKLDQNSVALIIPKSGSSTAFMEPTVNGTCCILFAGRGGPESSILSTNPNSHGDYENRTAALAETLVEQFPLLEGADLEDIAEQLISQKPGTASSVQCNSYHFGNSVAIAGDAAHATGGVSGQGVNSALLDAVALSECILERYDPSSKEASLELALLDYSKCQLPEGKALYDLSFGPKPTGIKKVIYLLKGLRDTIFQGRFGIGKPPLQTLLTTSIESFASIRRKLNYFYDAPFPSQSSFDKTIDRIAAESNATNRVLDEANKMA